MPELHRWTDPSGQEWACAAYDHGPFCRLCKPITDDIERALISLAEDGDCEVRTDANGEFEFKLTDQGKRATATLLGDLVPELNDGHVFVPDDLGDHGWPSYTCVVCGKRKAEHIDGDVVA